MNDVYFFIYSNKTFKSTITYWLKYFIDIFKCIMRLAAIQF